MDVKIKICGLTNVEDAIAALEAGADMLGFVLWEKSPRYVSIETAREIARQLPAKATRIGVFVDAKVEQVMFSLRICDFAGLQFHGQESPAFCSQFSVMKIKAFRIRDEASLDAISGYDTDAYLLDSYCEGQPGGTGETFNWALAAKANVYDRSIFLAGGLTPGNVAQAVKQVRPFAVDVSSGVEVVPWQEGQTKNARLCGGGPRCLAGFFMPSEKTSRCPWPTDDLYVAYHDSEWGVPLHDDRGLFEFIILEGAQAGLSWHIILKKREGYRAAFDHFDPAKVARYNAAKIAHLLENPGIVRNRLKVASAVQNAKSFLAVQEEFGSFDKYIWRFVEGKPIVNHWRSMKEVPARTAVSDAMSRDLLQRGFKFVGSTICYANMQATGMVNDHLITCFRHKAVQG